ncbi:MAG TPA: riboflavin synthase [Dehalococcoidia bacterium]|nr:riboflavin synthase [Dehalococcoidia bacterium]
MFTGIVQEVGTVKSAPRGGLNIAADILPRRMELGGSVAINGVCLTVTDFEVGSFSVDVMPETRRRTNLGLLKNGDRVNLELPLTLSGQVGGHLVQGHIDDTARVASVVRSLGELNIKLETSPELMRYVVAKGFVAVDGISLTVVSRDASSFLVSIIDYTRKNTILDDRRVGDLVNLEVDIIAKYVEQLSREPGSGITIEFLEKHGFPVG